MKIYSCHPGIFPLIHSRNCEQRALSSDSSTVADRMSRINDTISELLSQTERVPKMMNGVGMCSDEMSAQEMTQDRINRICEYWIDSDHGDRTNDQFSHPSHWITIGQVCKFVCLMSDMSLSPVSVLCVFVGLWKSDRADRHAIGWPNIFWNSWSIGDICEVVIGKLDKLLTNYCLKDWSFYRTMSFDRWSLKSYRSPVSLSSVYAHNFELFTLPVSGRLSLPVLCRSFQF
jgi:hypothetical protein